MFVSCDGGGDGGRGVEVRVVVGGSGGGDVVAFFASNGLLFPFRRLVRLIFSRPYKTRRRTLLKSFPSTPSFPRSLALSSALLPAHPLPHSLLGILSSLILSSRPLLLFPMLVPLLRLFPTLVSPSALLPWVLTERASGRRRHIAPDKLCSLFCAPAAGGPKDQTDSASSGAEHRLG